MRIGTWFLAILFLLTAAQAAPVNPDQAQVAAATAAQSVWGNLNVLQSDLLLKPNGEASAYCVIFGRNGVTQLDPSVIEIGYNLRQSGSVTEGWRVARAAESYVYAIVSADDQYGPILEMCDGLPAHLIFREDVKAMAGTNAQIIANYYLYPLENWYLVNAVEGSVVVNPRREQNVSPEVFAEFQTLYQQPANGNAEAYWSLVLASTILETDNSAYIAGVPNYNQASDDCGPHAAAQAVGYWDNHTYSGQGPWPLLIDTDFWGLRDEMRTATGWIQGWGVTVGQIVSGIELCCNDPSYNNNYDFDAVLHSSPAYSDVTSAMEAGRPGVLATYGHPTYGNHGMTVIGYNDTPSQMIQVHDNWPPDTDEPMIAWGLSSQDYVDVFPSGGGPATPIALQSFQGYFNNGSVMLSWIVASEADCYGYNVLRRSGETTVTVNSSLIMSSANPTETYTYHLTDAGISAGGDYAYSLQTVYIDGRMEISAEISVKALNYGLAQNNPNPFNPSTSITYTVPNPGVVNLTVFDILGQDVATMVNHFQEANSYTVVFNGTGLSSGIYLYRLQVGEFTALKKMVLIK
ncbi:MAG: T9SS type A sorting domain-containing protein [bacterium]